MLDHELVCEYCGEPVLRTQTRLYVVIHYWCQACADFVPARWRKLCGKEHIVAAWQQEPYCNPITGEVKDYTRM